MNWFAENAKNSEQDSYRGLKLWVDYRGDASGDKKDGVVKRHWILDGTDVTFPVVLNRLERERKILKKAGVTVDLDEGWFLMAYEIETCFPSA